MNKEKVLHVVEAMGGGVFTYIVNLCNEMVEEYDVYIAYAVRKQTPTNFKSYFDKRVKLIEVKNFTRSINLKKDFNALYELKKIEEQIKPDIIHIHSSKAGVLGRIAFSNNRLFYTPHGYAFLKKDESILTSNIYKGIEWVLAKGKCKTIACGKGEYEQALKLSKHSTYVNNGINIDEIDMILNNYTNKATDITVFTIGRIGYQKNPELFNEIAKSFPEINFKWIGDGELRNQLDASNIEITGWLERKEVIRQAFKSDIFILTSLWEGLPISLLEAMYLKKPCIVSDVSGNKEVISNQINGFVCSNINEYKLAIKKCIKKTDDIDKLIQNAYEDIIAKYNIKVMAKCYTKIYSGNNSIGNLILSLK